MQKRLLANFQMKVIQINTVGNYGSTGRIAEQIGIAASARGWKSYIACARKLRPSASEIIKLSSPVQIAFNGLWQRIFDTDSPISKIAVKELSEAIIKISPDIIHLHNTHGYYLNNPELLRFLSSYGRPVIWTLHDCWVLTGHCCYFESSGCRKWKTLCGNCPQKKEYPSSFICDSSRRNHKLKQELINSIPKLTLVPVSRWLNGLLKESALKDIPSKVIHNGIDLDTFKPTYIKGFLEKYSIPNKKIVLFVSSIWEERKGFNLISRIASLLGGEYICVAVGVNRRQKEYLSKYGIIGVSRTESPADLASLYTAASVFANPTFEDNYPTVNLESIACGTPVVTFNSGGASETIPDGAGIAVPRGDVEAMVQSIKRLSSEESTETAGRLRGIAENNFSGKIAWNKYIDIYEESLS